MAHGLFIKLDPRFVTHRKSVKVGPFGRLLYISALGYCVEMLTDGFIPDQVVARLADVDDPDITASVTALVTHRLWRKVDGGYQVHDYTDWQTSSDTVAKTRENGRRRQQKHREKNGNGVSNGVTNGDVTRAEPEPEPEPEPEEKGEAADAAAPIVEDTSQPTPSEFMQAWNAAVPFAPIRSMSDKRRDALRVRRCDSAWRRDWQTALAKVRGSPFLRGENDRGWMIDVEFFLRPDSVTKILEGTYDDKATRRNSRPLSSANSNDGRFEKVPVFKTAGDPPANDQT